MSDFEELVFNHILLMEGGAVDDPDDKGGRTNFGITQRVYDAYRRHISNSLGLPSDVWLISLSVAKDIMVKLYLNPIKVIFNDNSLRLYMVDFVFNSGHRNAYRVLQRALNRFIDIYDLDIEELVIDGIVGNKTSAVIRKAEQLDSRVLLAIIHKQRVQFILRHIRRGNIHKKFKRGLLNRLNKTFKKARSL